MKKRMWVFSLLLVLLAATALSAAGCGKDASAATTAEPVSTTAPAQPSTTETVVTTEAVVTTTAAPAGKTVTDMAGRQVMLPEEVESVATFGAIGVLNTMVETLASGAKIVNQMSPRFTKGDQWKYQYVFAPRSPTDRCSRTPTERSR